MGSMPVRCSFHFNSLVPSSKPCVVRCICSLFFSAVGRATTRGLRHFDWNRAGFRTTVNQGLALVARGRVLSLDDDLVILSHPVESASFSFETKYEIDAHWCADLCRRLRVNVKSKPRIFVLTLFLLNLPLSRRSLSVCLRSETLGMFVYTLTTVRFFGTMRMLYSINEATSHTSTAPHIYVCWK